MSNAERHREGSAEKREENASGKASHRIPSKAEVGHAANVICGKKGTSVKERPRSKDLNFMFLKYVSLNTFWTIISKPLKTDNTLHL